MSKAADDAFNALVADNRIPPEERERLHQRMREHARSILIEGVGPDAPVVVNEYGGKKSDTPYRADLLPPLALLAIAKVLRGGEVKYGENNWHRTTISENVNHAMVHLLAYQGGDKQESHLEHAACRLLFALELELMGRNHHVQSSKAESEGVGSVGCCGQNVGCHESTLHCHEGSTRPCPGS